MVLHKSKPQFVQSTLRQVTSTPLEAYKLKLDGPISLYVVSIPGSVPPHRIAADDGMQLASQQRLLHDVQVAPVGEGPLDAAHEAARAQSAQRAHLARERLGGVWVADDALGNLLEGERAAREQVLDEVHAAELRGLRFKQLLYTVWGDKACPSCSPFRESLSLTVTDTARLYVSVNTSCGRPY